MRTYATVAAVLSSIAMVHSASAENILKVENADGTLDFVVEVRAQTQSVQLMTQDGEVVLCLDTTTMGDVSATTLVLPLTGRDSDLTLTATSFREPGCRGLESAVGVNSYTIQVPPMSPILK